MSFTGKKYNVRSTYIFFGFSDTVDFVEDIVKQEPRVTRASRTLEAIGFLSDESENINDQGHSTSEHDENDVTLFSTTEQVDRTNENQPQFRNGSLQLDQNRFYCHLCGKSYLRHPHLLRHLRQHKGSARKHCSYCMMEFSRSDSLLRHLKKSNCSIRQKF